MVVDDTTTSGMSGYVVVCENRSVLPTDDDCIRYYLNQDEIIFQDDGSVVYTGHNRFLPDIFFPGQYEALPDGRIAICVNLDDYNVPIIINNQL